MSTGIRPPRPFYRQKMVTPVKTRWQLIFEVEGGLTVAQAAKCVGISKKAARNWWARYVATGGVEERPKRGRPPAMSQQAKKRAHGLLLKGHPDGTSGVAEQLHQEGLTSTKCHRTTVVRGAVSYGKETCQKIRCLRGKPVKRLSQATKQKRLQYARANMRTNWKAVLFTDRSKFAFSYPGAKVMPVEWALEGQARQAASVNHPQVYNLYAGLSYHAVTVVHQVAGTSGSKTAYKNQRGQAARNITTEEYKDVLNNTLLPAGTRIFNAQGMGTWVLQQDNDPTHKIAGEAIKDWNYKKVSSVKLMANWPPNSPDLSPIENLWSMVQARVNAQGCENFTCFKAAVEKELRNTPKEVLESLVMSMPKRMKKVIEAGGDRIKY